MQNILLNHRTVRKYTDRTIAPELMNRLLEAACRASNTGNMQTYSIVVTTDEAKKQELAPAHFNQKMTTEAPAVLTFCADFNRFNKWCSLRRAAAGYGNFLSFTSAMIDALLAAQNFCIAAESEGLGICYLGTTTYNADKIIDALNLPDYVVPITTITVGYPAEVPATQEDRLPLDGIVHHNIYKDYTGADIERIYSRKENLESSKKFVAENQKQTLAQVFTDIRYPKATNEYFSQTLIEVLKRQGFMN